MPVSIHYPIKSFTISYLHNTQDDNNSKNGVQIKMASHKPLHKKNLTNNKVIYMYYVHTY